MKIPITAWSATDYAYLVNNGLGCVSDDERFWEFENEAKMQKFQAYLNLSPEEQTRLVLS